MIEDRGAIIYRSHIEGIDMAIIYHAPFRCPA